jgi:hypothetical protein
MLEVGRRLSNPVVKPMEQQAQSQTYLNYAE